ncbi:hypothetical protein C3L33_06635, partial [Rhododendron williamsianum]
MTSVTHFGSKMVAQGFTVDLNKPLVFQVGHLGEAYQEWVHQPIASKEGPRFFESDFWEHLLVCSDGPYASSYSIDDGLRGNTIHYLLHGCHHKHPMDGLRLVFPPAATAVLFVPFWKLVELVFTPSLTPAMFGGGLLGYVMYDVTHYYLHHGQPTSEIPRNLKVRAVAAFAT